MLALSDMPKRRSVVSLRKDDIHPGLWDFLCALGDEIAASKEEPEEEEVEEVEEEAEEPEEDAAEDEDEDRHAAAKSALYQLLLKITTAGQDPETQMAKATSIVESVAGVSSVADVEPRFYGRLHRKLDGLLRETESPPPKKKVPKKKVPRKKAPAKKAPSSKRRPGFFGTG